LNYGRYEIIREIGRGSMGMVYLARDPQIGRDIALKVLRPDRVESEDFVRRFLREARAIGRMSHPNVVTVHDVGEDHGTVYIAMELLEGEPLNVYAAKRTLRLEDIAGIGAQIARCLDYAHGRGIVHRDVKPQNIIVSPDGTVKLTDFGIAHIEDPEAGSQTQAGEILGTPNYMSPEQVMGKKVDGRSDIFSLGVILYELASGTRPFKGADLASVFHAITSSEPEALDAMNPETRGAFSGIVMKCLAKDPAERFQTGSALARELGGFLAGRTSAPGAAPRPRHRRTIAAAAVVAVACLVLGGILLYRATVSKAPVETADLRVESVPEGAQVYVDGRFGGKTPARVKVSEGSHEVRLSMPGYYEWEAVVQAQRGSSTPLKVELVPSAE